MGTTMRNIILAVILAAPIAAFAADPNSRMEASGECVECQLRGASGLGASGLKAIPVSATRSVAAAPTLPNLSSLAVQIGRVETVKEITDENGVTGIGEGNGIVISPCMVITNQHQLYGADLAPDTSVDRPIGFYFGQGVSTFKWKLDGSPVRVGYRTKQGGQDWALVKLKTCAGKKVGYPELDLRTAEQLTGVSLNFVAISPEIENGILQAPVRCTARGKDPISGALLHNCPTVHGHSGGGLFTDDGKLVAIIGGKNASGETAITMAEVMSDVPARSLVETDKKTFLAEQGQGPALAAIVAAGHRATL